MVTPRRATGMAQGHIRADGSLAGRFIGPDTVHQSRGNA